MPDRRSRLLDISAKLLALAVAAGAVLFLLETLVYPRVEESARRALWRDARDLDIALARQAANQSAAFILQHMGMAKPYQDKFALFDAALNRVDPKLNGLFCEFGVWKGETINYIASKTAATVHGFDSFEGLPEDWRAGFEAGMFKVGSIPGVRPNVMLHKGWFKDSLPGFAQAHAGALAFAHLDADLYSSTKDVLDALGHRIVAGTVLQFDEFFNYPGWQDGESKAFLEFCRARQAEVEYLGYVPTHEQVAVRIKSIAPAAQLR